MNFTLSPEQLLIKDSVARFAAGPHAGTEKWPQFAELGWLAIGAPDELGGFGGPIETLLLMEQFGRGLVVSPYVAQVEIELEALAFTELRTLAAESAGKRPGPESSILKIKGTEIQQAISELALDALGPYAERHLAPKYFNYRKTSIYAGSNEIQKNIIAKRILKL